MATRAETIATRRAKVEQYLATGMGVHPWCTLNHIKPATFYDWLEYFRDNDPDVFGGYEIAHAGDGHRNWFQRVTMAMRESRALAPAADPAPPAFAIVDTADLRAAGPAAQPASAPAAAFSVTVRARGVEIDIPLAAGEAAIASLLRAVASL